MRIGAELTAPDLLRGHVGREAVAGAWPEALERAFPASMAVAALAEISSWPGYMPTPLLPLGPLATRLGLGDILWKDEGQRFGSGSFKALGGAYAVMIQARKWLARQGSGEGHGDVPLSAIRAGAYAGALRDFTVACATDGNHGRAVARGARMAGCGCIIFIHAGVSEGRKAAMEACGAEVRRVAGDYDASLKECADAARRNGWCVVSDTSWPGYTEIPRDVMAGYTVMASEIMAQVEAPPTHMFVQVGVGGFAAAMVARFRQMSGAAAPRTVSVEPELAPCALESARRNAPSCVQIHTETAMAGLSCGEVSGVAWPILAAGCADYVTVGEEAVGAAMRLLASGAAGARIVAGESGVAGLLGLMAVCARPELKARFALGPDSRVLLIGSEGATDPEIYRAMLAGA